LDVLRGLAALAVVCWHWPHFFSTGTAEAPFQVERLPFYDFLLPLYHVGGLGVEMFFSLSGFIFYWLYSRTVTDATITTRDFLVLRLSRLYPLHLVTLLAVALGQAAYSRMANSPFVFAFNDAYHFGLNLLFAFSWGMEKGYSFNGPAWSVSVEIALYGLFFLLCRWLPIRAAVLGSMAAAGLVIRETLYPPLGEGMLCFFLGGLAYLLYRRIVATSLIEKVAKWLPFLTGAMWLGGIVAVALPWGEGFSTRTWSLLYLYPPVILFPLTILTLAVAETRRGEVGRGVAFLGDISYSSYLLHFPLQLALVLAVTSFGLNRAIFYSPYVFIGFFGLLFLLSLGTYRYFELPMQRALRRWWLSSPGRPLPAG
jgi:peptidoglycan/LPS O-acetylase OafA/YrhL